MVQIYALGPNSIHQNKDFIYMCALNPTLIFTLFSKSKDKIYY